MTKNWQLLWGKTDEQSDQIHPLLFHMLDTGNITQALWTKAFPNQLKKDLCTYLSLESEAAGRLIAFWAALHDIGKASPAFQSKHEASKLLQERAGLPFPALTTYHPMPHGLVSSWALSQEGARLHLEEEEAEALGRALGGHHGKWPEGQEFNHPARRDNLGKAPWQTVRLELLQILENVFLPPPEFHFPEEGLGRNLFLTLLSGLVSAADWLSSMQQTFPAAGYQQTWMEYLLLSVQQANRAVLEQGWQAWNDPTAGEPIPFQQAFPRLCEPRPVQAAVIDHASGAALPALAMIEAPTGIGKTEIAFLMADGWLRRSGGRGLYVAMPTQATSNQMHERVRGFLSIRFPKDMVNLHLVHGHALLQEDFEKSILRSVGEEPEAKVAAAGWFLPRKRTLLAPYGVGTVDQVFLSVLQTRHFFVRLFGLQGKVVVFDEVHAYDAYQSELFCRLLAWLRALNVSVILLSATLPAAVRKKFISAYGGNQGTSAIGFPRLTLVTKGQVNDYQLPESPSYPVALDQLGQSPEEVIAYLREKLGSGGCAAVICNTVARAQQIYQALVDSRLAPGATYLFHARFPFAWRDQIEKRVLRAFGPGDQRPAKPAVVVATQVIEQSLDLDFDLMVTELAPIDLLIQRAGRLHRHKRPFRPASVSAPRLAVMQTGQTQEGDPDFGPNSFVYRRYHLLRTQAVLAGRSELCLPEETPLLIEAVYGDETLEVDARTWELIQEARSEMEKAIQESVWQARKRIILPPEHEDLLIRHTEELTEDAPAVHSDFQALTREAPPGVSLVCLHRLPDGRWTVDPDDLNGIVDIDRVPEKEEINRLLRHSVQVQRPEVVRHFAAAAPHTPWKRCAPLRYHYPILFENGEACVIGLPLTIQLHRELGLSFTKEV